MSDDILKIDIDALLQSRLPRHHKFIPAFVRGWLKRIVHQDEINDILERSRGLKGVDMAAFVLNDLGITLNVEGLERLDDDKRYIFASNHPLGGLDGLALIALIGKRYNGRIKFLVNDLLMALKPFDDIFMPVNKFGRQSREAATMISDAYRSDLQMLTFPAGLCSRLQPDGTVADLKWQKHFVAHAIQDERDVIPVYVKAQNSRFFYRLAKLRAKLGIKFNIEMMFLPDEMFKARNSHLDIVIGQPIPHTQLDASRQLDEAARIRNIVYKLEKK